jgi:hypothetical protein
MPEPNPIQLREKDGKQEIWDLALQQWRPVQPLDQVPKPKKEGNYRCELCNAAVEVVIHFDGWEVETVDPQTGERVDVIDGERVDIHEEEWRCSMGCGWRGDFEWFERIGNEEEEARKAQEEADKVVQPKTTNLHHFPNRQPNEIEGNFFRLDPRGGFRLTPWPGRDTT